jgi:hypothetical protein
LTGTGSLKVADLKNGTRFEIALSPGEHLCRAEMLGTRHTFGNTEDSTVLQDLALEIRPGPKQWVSVRFKFVGMTKSMFRLSPEDPSKASKEVEKKHIRMVEPSEQAIRSITRTAAGSSPNR